MVARYSTGEKYAGHAETVVAVIAETDTLRARALRLAEEDAAAFTAVTDAYRLPKGEERSAALTTARVNVEVNLGGIKDERVRDELNIRLSGVDAAVARADRVTAEVREEINR